MNKQGVTTEVLCSVIRQLKDSDKLTKKIAKNYAVLAYRLSPELPHKTCKWCGWTYNLDILKYLYFCFSIWDQTLEMIEDDQVKICPFCDLF